MSNLKIEIWYYIGEVVFKSQNISFKGLVLYNWSMKVNELVKFDLKRITRKFFEAGVSQYQVHSYMNEWV